MADSPLSVVETDNNARVMVRPLEDRFGVELLVYSDELGVALVLDAQATTDLMTDMASALCRSRGMSSSRRRPSTMLPDPPGATLERTVAQGVDIPTHGGAMMLNVRRIENGAELTLCSDHGGRHVLAYIPVDSESARRLAHTLLTMTDGGV